MFNRYVIVVPPHQPIITHLSLTPIPGLHNGFHHNGLRLPRALLKGRPGGDLEGDGRGIHGVEAAVLQRRLDVHHGETHADAVQQLALEMDGWMDAWGFTMIYHDLP